MAIRKLQRMGAAIVVIQDDGSRVLCYPTPTGLWYPVQGGGVDPDPGPGPDPDNPWQWPFPRRSITAGYMTPDRPTHRGTDWALPDAEYLAPIPCIGNGTVEQVGADAYGGLFVIVNHGDVPGYGTIRSHYVHQDSNSVSVGQSVTTGQTIGYVGYTGYTIPEGIAGAHLHLQINLSNDPYNGPTMDPVTFLEGVGATGE